MKFTIKNSIIDLSDEDVKDLKRQLEGKEKSIWDLQNRDKYWFITAAGDISSDAWDDTPRENEWRDAGNIFLTQASAEKELSIRKAIMRVRKWVWENDAEGVWDGKTSVWEVWYWSNNRFTASDANVSRVYTPFGYIKSEELCEKLIKEMEADLKIIFDVT